MPKQLHSTTETIVKKGNTTIQVVCWNDDTIDVWRKDNDEPARLLT